MRSVVRDSNLRDCYISPSKPLSSRLLCTPEVVRTNSPFSLHLLPFSPHSALSLSSHCVLNTLSAYSAPPASSPYYQIFSLQRSPGGSPVPLLYALKCKAPAEFVQIGIGADNLFWVLAGTVKLKCNYKPNKNNSECPADCHTVRSHADIQVLVLCSNVLISSLFACVLLDLRAFRCHLRRRMSRRVRHRVVW